MAANSDIRAVAAPTDLPNELVSLWTRVGSLQIHARAIVSSYDDNLPIVLVHGFGVSSSYFVPAMQWMGRDFTVYAPDLPGHGMSDTPARAFDIPELADALLAWMDETGLARVALVGNSMGSQIAVEAVRKDPDRIDRLVLVGPVVEPAFRTPAALLLRVLKDVIYERPSLGLIVVADYARMGRRLIPEFQHMLSYSLEKRLSELSLPTLILRGEKDPVSSQSWCEEVGRLLPSASVAVIPREGHAVHYSAPEQFSELVASFLRVRLVHFEGG